MPGPYVVPVHGDEELPKECDVVVIGGGIVGCSTALELAERGLRVTLCEKGGIGKEQSSRNWGWVRISMRDPREVPLMAEALRIWDGLDKRTGRDTGFKRAGIIFTCANDKEVAERERWRTNLDGYQIESRMLTAQEFGETVPGSSVDMAGALYHTKQRRRPANPRRPMPNFFDQPLFNQAADDLGHRRTRQARDTSQISAADLA